MTKLLKVIKIYEYETLKDAERDINALKNKEKWIISEPVKSKNGYIVEFTEMQ